MKTEIINRLKEIESKYDIRILHACESGSRAWGFPSPDSDYDVRFIYVHKEDWYLSIDDKKNTIELPINDDLDITGWELRKALKLLRKSNVPILEHLHSPIVYMNKDDFYLELKETAANYFSQRAILHHFLSMSKNVVSNFEGDEVKLKAYFYALRTSLAAHWVIDEGTIPPLQFEKLVKLIDDENIIMKISELLELKAVKNETYFHPREIDLEKFIFNTIDYCTNKSNIFEKNYVDSEALNMIFRKYLKS